MPPGDDRIPSPIVPPPPTPGLDGYRAVSDAAPPASGTKTGEVNLVNIAGSDKKILGVIVQPVNSDGSKSGPAQTIPIEQLTPTVMPAGAASNPEQLRAMLQTVTGAGSAAQAIEKIDINGQNRSALDTSHLFTYDPFTKAIQPLDASAFSGGSQQRPPSIYDATSQQFLLFNAATGQYVQWDPLKFDQAMASASGSAGQPQQAEASQPRQMAQAGYGSGGCTGSGGASYTRSSCGSGGGFLSRIGRRLFGGGCSSGAQQQAYDSSAGGCGGGGSQQQAYDSSGGGYGGGGQQQAYESSAGGYGGQQSPYGYGGSPYGGGFGGGSGGQYGGYGGGFGSPYGGGFGSPYGNSGMGGGMNPMMLMAMMSMMGRGGMGGMGGMNSMMNPMMMMAMMNGGMGGMGGMGGYGGGGGFGGMNPMMMAMMIPYMIGMFSNLGGGSSGGTASGSSTRSVEGSSTTTKNGSVTGPNGKTVSGSETTNHTVNGSENRNGTVHVSPHRPVVHPPVRVNARRR
jgi:hypothetical protein